MEAWKKYLRKGYSTSEVQEIIRQYYYEDGPAKLIDQIKWLEAIGFRNVDVIRKYYNFAILGVLNEMLGIKAKHKFKKNYY